MKIDFQQKISRSLFLKIVLVFVAAYFVITSVSVYTHQTLFRKRHFPKIQQNSVNYSRYIIQELGCPPDTVFARQLVDSLGIQMRFEGSGMTWTSSQDMPQFDDLDFANYKGDNRIHVGMHRGLYVDIQKEKGRYLFIMGSRQEDLQYLSELHALINIITATLIIIGIYFTIRWLLKPVKVLHQGVHELSSGNLDYEMVTRRNDELGELVNSFNEMVRRIKEMLHARKQLLLDVSHELRSPLTRVNVALEFLEESNAKQNIREDISEMETMITELLETERLESKHGGLDLKKTNLKELMDNVCSDFANQKPGVKMLSFPDSIILDVDPKRIRILFNNVIANALKYSQSDGYPVEISLREKQDEIIIAVQDFGEGIPEMELPFIFEPFYRVDKSRSKETGGYGLGMNLSKKIMEAHGGSIEMSSRLSVGTTVFLTFKK